MIIYQIWRWVLCWWILSLQWKTFKNLEQFKFTIWMSRIEMLTGNSEIIACIVCCDFWRLNNNALCNYCNFRESHIQLYVWDIRMGVLILQYSRSHIIGVIKTQNNFCIYCIILFMDFTIISVLWVNASSVFLLLEAYHVKKEPLLKVMFVFS